MKLPPGHVAGMGVHKATAYGGFGQKMLEKMGWNKGQGLGKEKHGMKEAIEVKKKEDNLGVGANTTGWKWDWKYWEDAYNTGLQSLSKADSKKKRRKKPSSSSSSSSDSSSSSGSEESQAGSDSDSSESDDEHNARLAEACGIVLNRDGTAASASAAEIKLAQQLAKDTRGRAGRFGGREGKMARIRQQEAEQAAAMQAKLGIPASVSAGDLRDSSASEDTSAGKKSKKRKHSEAAIGSGSSSDAADVSAAAAAGQKKKGKQQKQSSRPEDSSQQQQQQDAGDPAAGGSSKRRVVVVVDIKGAGPNVEAFKAFKPTPSTGWWGAKMFSSAGLLEGIDEEQQQKQRQRTTFDEDMQTAVYMAAHDSQRQGKRGLGKSTTLKIAGGSWQGKKVTFDQEAPAGLETLADGQPGDAHHQQQQAADGAASSLPSSDADAAAATGQRECSIAKKKRKKQQKSSSSKPGKVKWAKLAVEQLQGTPGGVLKWSKLWKQLKQTAQQQQGAVEDVCKEKAWEKLQGCDRLQVTGKLVSLAA